LRATTGSIPKLVRELNATGKRDVPLGAPMPFPKSWKAAILDGGRIDRRRYETATMVMLRERLASGDLWVEGNDRMMPQVRITELMAEVAARTGFTAAFAELRSGREHPNPEALLAAILADATNLAVERMANASQGVTYAQLAWTHGWYLSEENYAAALARIVERKACCRLRACGATARHQALMASSSAAAGAGRPAMSMPATGPSRSRRSIPTSLIATARSIAD
jgi:hypothetical protein